MGRMMENQWVRGNPPYGWTHSTIQRLGQTTGEAIRVRSKGSTLKVPDRGRGGEASGRARSMSWTPGRKLGASRPSRTLQPRKRQKCLCFNTPDGACDSFLRRPALQY
jgi:hypothetical protein